MWRRDCPGFVNHQRVFAARPITASSPKTLTNILVSIITLVIFNGCKTSVFSAYYIEICREEARVPV